MSKANLKSLILTVLLFLISTINVDALEYQIVDLSTQLTGYQDVAMAINNKGQIVGHTPASDGIWHGFLYEKGAVQLLDTFGGTYSLAHGINNYGVIVGEYDIAKIHAFSYDGELTDFGITCADAGSIAYDINDSGQVVGKDCDQATLFNNQGANNLLGTMGGNWSLAEAINNQGQIVGHAYYNDGSRRAFLYENDSMIDLFGEQSRAYDINDKGQIVGTHYVPSEPGTSSRGFIYENGVETPLYDFRARAINNFTQITGIAVNIDCSMVCPNCELYPAVYDNGVITCLKPLRDQDTEVTAVDINDKGQIVGASCIVNNNTYDCHAVLWNPICSISFSDVPPEHWSYFYVNEIKDKNITSGCGNCNYCPQNIVNRAQMAAFVIRGLVAEGRLDQEPSDNYCGTTNPFPDVPYDHWACKYLKKATELGITSGYPDGTYKLTNKVNRAEMAVYIIRAREGNPTEGCCGDTDPFSDVVNTHWACSHIKRLSELNISSGYQDGSYRPTEKVNRAQMAVYVARAFLGMQ